MNLLTYLIDHRDGREGNFLMSTDPDDPRIFAIDNGIAFEGFPWNFFVPNWNKIRVPWLRADPIARLRALPPEEVDRLGSLFDMDADAQGVLRLGAPDGSARSDEGRAHRTGQGSARPHRQGDRAREGAHPGSPRRHRRRQDQDSVVFLGAPVRERESPTRTRPARSTRDFEMLRVGEVAASGGSSKGVVEGS